MHEIVDSSHVFMKYLSKLQRSPALFAFSFRFHYRIVRPVDLSSGHPLQYAICTYKQMFWCKKI